FRARWRGPRTRATEHVRHADVSGGPPGHGGPAQFTFGSSHPPGRSERADQIVTTSVPQKIAEEIGVRERQVTSSVELLDGGATVPFIARYRKEVTGALDDTQLRTLEERLRYLRELEERRATV